MSPETTTSWIDIREKVVDQALQDGDYEALRRISALPGGFGSECMRRRVWPVLLQTERYCTPCSAEPGEQNDPAQVPHKDEAQVGLDTNRSFVVYPTGILPERKQAMQADLHDLIIGVLRRYPALSYFQGYHDILSVLYLTFIPQPVYIRHPRSRTTSRTHSRSSSGRYEKRLSECVESDEKVSARNEKNEEDINRHTEEWKTLRHCAEAISVLRVRDAMGSGMEGMMGMLRILKRILKAADPELARFSSQISPVPTLPFFALSWILCLFSHDVDTLEPVQRMFDFLLARNPISAIYLAVAILMAKKIQMLRLAQELGPEAADDPSLLHPLFSRLPPLFPDTPNQPTPTRSSKSSVDMIDPNETNPYDPLPLSELFQLADRLMVDHPWDGAEVQGQEIMGRGSVVLSYDLEMKPPPHETPSDEGWTMADALKLVDQEVVRPGVAMMDDDEEEEEEPIPVKRTRTRRRQRWLIRLGRNKMSTTLALGIVVLGVSMAVFGVRAGGPNANWARWWAAVLGKKLASKGTGLGDLLGGRLSGLVGSAAEVGRYLVSCLKDVR